jgi:glyoxylase-like metal-dependent hydrolase (beta-lactamase superfamily II)
VRVGQFEIRAIETPGHASHHHVYHWNDNVFGGDIAGVRIGAGPPIPPFVPPELHIESWIESIHKIRALNCARLYLPHFGKIDYSIPDHLDALEERVTRWSEWLKGKLLAIRNPKSEIRNLESELIPAFAEYEHVDLRAWGATEDDVQGYETADPSYMAVSAAIRYWKKYHPEEIASPVRQSL